MRCFSSGRDGELAENKAVSVTKNGAQAVLDCLLSTHPPVKRVWRPGIQALKMFYGNSGGPLLMTMQTPRYWLSAPSRKAALSHFEYAATS